MWRTDTILTSGFFLLATFKVIPLLMWDITDHIMQVKTEISTFQSHVMVSGTWTAFRKPTYELNHTQVFILLSIGAIGQTFAIDAQHLLVHVMVLNSGNIPVWGLTFWLQTRLILSMDNPQLYHNLLSGRSKNIWGLVHKACRTKMYGAIFYVQVGMYKN